MTRLLALRVLATVIAIAISILAIACSEADRSWRKVEEANSPTAYMGFLHQFPDSEYAIEAQQRLLDVKPVSDAEECSYRRAAASGRPWEFVRFMDAFPESALAAAADASVGSYEIAEYQKGDRVPMAELRESLGWDGELSITCGSIRETTTIDRDGTTRRSTGGEFCLGNVDVQGALAVSGDELVVVETTRIAATRGELPAFVPEWVGSAEDREYFESSWGVGATSVQLSTGPQDDRIAVALACRGFHVAWKRAYGFRGAEGAEREALVAPGTIWVGATPGFEQAEDEVAEYLATRFPEYQVNRYGELPDRLRVNWPFNAKIGVSFRPTASHAEQAQLHPEFVPSGG